MTTVDVLDKAAWTTRNQGSEYSASVPLESPRLPHGLLNVLMVCEGREFAHEDRVHAQRRVDALPQRLDLIFSRIMDFLGLREPLQFHAAKDTPTLMLEAGDYTRWIFAMDSVPQDASLFVEWQDDQIVDLWIET